MNSLDHKKSKHGISAIFHSVLSVFPGGTHGETEGDDVTDTEEVYDSVSGYLDLNLLRLSFEKRLEHRKQRQRHWQEEEERQRLLDAQRLEENEEEATDLIAESPEEEIADIPWSVDYGDYRLPSLDLLFDGSCEPALIESELEIAENKRIIQDTLDSFRIDAEVGNATVGPRITLYEVYVARGVRVESIANLAKNFAMALSANGLRILAPVPGQNYVGIEVPNHCQQKVWLRDLLSSRDFLHSTASLPLALGKNLCNEGVIYDLAKAPHLLIAGATGSGKSVCINAIIMSLLYRFSPEDLRLILVDPKVVELSIYGTLPHLVCPVVTDTRQIGGVLNWVVNEMELRYKILGAAKVRNIHSFNQTPHFVGEFNGIEIPEKLPFLVVVIDELADIMLTARAETEVALARLAQKSRAVGIHTIVATQRPSVDVITGDIKANYPTRIAFKVSSVIDSQTILGGKGAETLLGSGDMLFFGSSAMKPERLQCPMVFDDEAEQVVKQISSQCPQRFTAIFSGSDFAENESAETQEGDPLVDEAIEVLRRYRRATISHLQRRLSIGYNRAAALMEELEKRKIVGPANGTNPREIFLDEVE